MKRYYYTRESAHGSSTSHGFANDTVVGVFDSKKARDEYVKNSKNLSCQAIRRNEATKEANIWSMTQNCYSGPKPFSGEFWAIVEPYDEPWCEGHIGTVECCNKYSYGMICKFYQ